MHDYDKKWIDDSTYEQLLRTWRFARVGERLLEGETGEYFAKVMNLKRSELPRQGPAPPDHRGEQPGDVRRHPRHRGAGRVPAGLTTTYKIKGEDNAS